MWPMCLATWLKAYDQQRRHQSGKLYPITCIVSSLYDAVTRHVHDDFIICADVLLRAKACRRQRNRFSTYQQQQPTY